MKLCLFDTTSMLGLVCIISNGIFHFNGNYDDEFNRSDSSSSCNGLSLTLAVPVSSYNVIISRRENKTIEYGAIGLKQPENDNTFHIIRAHPRHCSKHILQESARKE